MYHHRLLNNTDRKSAEEKERPVSKIHSKLNNVSYCHKFDCMCSCGVIKTNLKIVENVVSTVPMFTETRVSNNFTSL